MKVALIPARGGSKRIPKKNIRLFCGKPMIVYAIEAALECGLFDEVIVSTDCDEIAEISKKHGASVPFKRPAALADDYAGTGAVICHGIETLRNNGQKLDYLCCIYPTSPLLQPEDLQQAFTMLVDAPNTDFCFSATRFPFAVQRGFVLDEQGHPSMLFPEHLNTRSQDLPEVFHDAGQFYLGKPQAFLDGLSMFSQHAVPYVMPRSKVMDIDTEEDWKEAELLYQLQQAKQEKG